MKAKVPYLIIIFLVIALLLSISKFSYKKAIDASNYTALNDTLLTFKNKIGTQTASIKTLQYSKAELQNKLFKKDTELTALMKKFAKVNNIVKYQTVMRLDTLQVVYHDSIPCVFNKVGNIKKPFYSFNYKSTQSGFTIDSLIIPNTTTVITGTKRKWFLGAETLSTDVTNSNPYITVTGITAAEVLVPSPWYKKWYVWLAAGIAGGCFIAK